MSRTMTRHAGAVRQRIGPVIHQVRTECGLTLAEVAQAAGISPSHLSRIERGATRPSYVVLDAIADALGTNINAIPDYAELDDMVTTYLQAAKLCLNEVREAAIKDLGIDRPRFL